MDFSSPNNPWDALQKSLAGSFTARARGVAVKSFVLLRDGGEEFGRLGLNGTAGADLDAGEMRVEIRREAGHHYRMTSGNQEVLTAKREGGSADKLQVSCGGKVYEARTSFIRNRAEAVSIGEEAVRVSGNLSGRRYEVFFGTEDGDALLVAVFLVYHTAAHRQRAYLATR